MSRIFHIAARADWDAAQSGGEYRVSTRGSSLDDGALFIHASRGDQVSTVANAVYADAITPLCLLIIETDRLTAPVRDEDPDGGGVTYPHVYGPLNLDAVVDVLAYDRGVDGRFPDPPVRG